MTVSVAILVGVVISVAISALSWFVYVRHVWRLAPPQEVAPEEISKSKVIEAFLVQATEAIRGGAIVPRSTMFYRLYAFEFQDVPVLISGSRYSEEDYYHATLDSVPLADGVVAQDVLRDLWHAASDAVRMAREEARRLELAKLETKLSALPVDSQGGNQS